MSMPSTHRFFLPRGIWVVTAVFLGLAAWMQIGRPTGDHGLDNVLTFAAMLIVGLTVGIWFVVFSSHPRRWRWGLAAAVVVGLTAFFTLFRLEGVGGEMMPRFGWRFREAADRRLSAPPAPGAAAAAAAATIDLTRTGPDDFPQFLGPDRDLSLDDVALDADWASRPPQLVWRKRIGAGWSGFAIVNGYAVTQEQRGALEMVTCYEVASGALVWSYAIANRFESVVAGIGPRATPTIDEGIVYALSSNGRLLALDGASGRLLWEHDLPAEYGMSPAQEAATIPYGRSGSPLIAGSLVIVPAGGAPGGRLVSLVAYDKKSGARIWEGGESQISQSSPALAMLAGVPQVLIVNESTVSGHDPDSGRVLWEHPWPGVTNADANVSQAVAVPPNRVFLSKGYGQGGALLELAAAPGGGIVAREVWHDARVLRTKFTNVTIHEGYVYGLSDGILECVDLQTGERAWKHGRYHHGQILRAGDLLIVLAEDGEVVLVEASPERRDNVLGRFQALSGTTWNTIALYGQYLMVRNAEEAAAYRLPLAR